MKIRKSKSDDLHDIMKLIHQAQNYFKSQGIDQWQDGYPHEDDILHDISLQKSYVIEDHQIIGTMFFTYDADPNYSCIDGKWLTSNQPYGVIHRIVIDKNKKGQGIAYRLLDFVIKDCYEHQVLSIRIDTHHDNLSMQRFLSKSGFQKCGNIHLESGALRIAFEKKLNI